MLTFLQQLKNISACFNEKLRIELIFKQVDDECHLHKIVTFTIFSRDQNHITDHRKIKRNKSAEEASTYTSKGTI